MSVFYITVTDYGGQVNFRQMPNIFLIIILLFSGSKIMNLLSVYCHSLYVLYHVGLSVFYAWQILLLLFLRYLLIAHYSSSRASIWIKDVFLLAFMHIVNSFQEWKVGN